MKVKEKILVIVSCLVSAPIFAAGHLKATISPTNAGTSSIIGLNILNDGDQPVAIYERAIPTKLRDGLYLPGSLYVVSEVNANGEKEVAYQGNWAHAIKFDDKQFITIDPGKTFKTTYDLSSDYPIEAGKTYHVFYETYIDAVPMGLDGKPLPTKLPLGTQKKLTSNVLNITPVKIIKYEKNASLTPLTSYPPVTDPDHLNILEQSLVSAYNMAVGVAEHYDLGAPPTFSITNEYSVKGNDYIYWFGTYNNGDANDYLVGGTVDGTANRMVGQYSGGSPTHPVAFQEGDDDCSDGQTAAVAQTGSVVQNGTYLIAICPLFYQLSPLPVTTSASSQVSTLIHEFSHFTDLPTDVRAAPEEYYGDGQPWMHPTGDYGMGYYTLSGAHNLSLSDRATAVKNASNYEFYFANTPEHE